jgi:hypothetical protein
MPEPKEELNIVMKASDILKKDEFMGAFKNVLEFVLKIQQRQQEAIAKLEADHARYMQQTHNEYASRHEELKGKVDNVFVESRAKTKTEFETLHKTIHEMLDGKMRAVDTRMAQVKDGYTPVRGKDYFDGLSGKDGKDADPKTIESLKKEIEAIKRIPRGGGRKVPMIRVVDLTSQVDGIVTTYTLPRDVVRVHQVWSTQFPNILRPITDFTLAGNTLTLTAQVGVIQSGQTLTAMIETLFYA